MGIKLIDLDKVILKIILFMWYIIFIFNFIFLKSILFKLVCVILVLFGFLKCYKIKKCEINKF